MSQHFDRRVVNCALKNSFNGCIATQSDGRGFEAQTPSGYGGHRKRINQREMTDSNVGV